MPGLSCKPTAQSPYNKCHCLNIGLESALMQGADVLSFIDADCWPGDEWHTGAEYLLAHPEVTKLAYRCRKLPKGQEPDFEHYDSFPLAWEAWGDPGRMINDERLAQVQADGEQPHGCANFSMTRAQWERLGSLLWNEAYYGYGYAEDLAFNWKIWQRAGNSYQCVIRPEPQYNLLHRWHGTQNPGWNMDELTARNQQYFARLKSGSEQ
jgi:hypothetical protein